MKKKFLMLFACFCLIVPACIFMTACGGDPASYQVKVEAKSGSTDYLMMNNNSVNSSSFEVEQGKNLVVNLMLAGNYDPDTLKIYNGENEVTWTKDSSLNANDAFSSELVKVGTLSLSNVQGDTNLKYEAQEKQISFTLKRADTNELTSDQETMLKSFKLASDDSKNLYSMLVTNPEGYTVTTTYSQRNSLINFVCEKFIGYYNTDNLNNNFKPNASVSKNTYSLTLSNDSAIYLNNEVEFNLSSIDINYLNINNVTSSLRGNYLSVSEEGSFKAGEQKQITFNLEKVAGVNYLNVMVYFNDIIIDHDFNTNPTYTLDLTNKLPIEYYKGDLSLLSENHFKEFNIVVTGLVITNACSSEFCSVDLSNASDELYFQTNLMYFIDKKDNIAYYTKEIGFEVSKNATNLKITLGTNTLTIDINDIVTNMESASLDWINNMLKEAGFEDNTICGITQGSENCIQITLKNVKNAKYTISVS